MFLYALCYTFNKNVLSATSELPVTLDGQFSSLSCVR
jgi:hypothetical protein